MFKAHRNGAGKQKPVKSSPHGLTFGRHPPPFMRPLSPTLAALLMAHFIKFSHVINVTEFFFLWGGILC